MHKGRKTLFIGVTATTKIHTGLIADGDEKGCGGRRANFTSG